MHTESRGSARAGISEFPLKIAAIAGMTCDHAAYIFADCMPYPLTCLFFLAGGITFLIMGFLLTEGYRYTHSVRGYALRLFAFAIVAEIPYWLFLGHALNVLFTLLLSLGLIYADDHVKDRGLFTLVFAGVLAVSLVCDWAVIGPVAVFLFKRLRGTRWEAAGAPAVTAAVTAAAAASGFAEASVWALPQLFYAAGNLGCALILRAYNGKRGRSMKYFFYAYYPAHILVLGIAHFLAFGYVTPLVG